MLQQCAVSFVKGWILCLEMLLKCSPFLPAHTASGCLIKLNQCKSANLKQLLKHRSLGILINGLHFIRLVLKCLAEQMFLHHEEPGQRSRLPPNMSNIQGVIKIH